MAASEARILANRQNAARSTGPRTPAGMGRSRANGLKHGLAGQGVVVPGEDIDEVESRAEALEADLRPRSALGAILVRKMALLSVRMERGMRQESAALKSRVRRAADDFDEARLDEAERLFDVLGDDPRGSLRKLRKSPEGVDRLVLAWRELRADLARDPCTNWTAAHLEAAAKLNGIGNDHARGSRLGALSRAVWGDFGGLAEHEGGDLGDDARKGWACGKLVERIDAEIAALEIHRDSLDLEAIELDRAEAGERALFDPSREATLARRYESEAHRGFFKALKEFRQAEAEAAERAESTPAPAPASGPAPGGVGPAGPLASSRERMTTPAPDPSWDFLDGPIEAEFARSSYGQPMQVGLAGRLTG